MEHVEISERYEDEMTLIVHRISSGIEHILFRYRFCVIQKKSFKRNILRNIADNS